MHAFTLVMTVGMVIFFVWILALGLWHPRTGADVLQWRPTRSPELEASNDIDDVAQMVAAQNALRQRHGKTQRTQAQVQAQVQRDQQALSAYADAYWDSRREGGAGLVVYEQPTCSKCQRLARILTERGIDFERVDYVIDPLPVERIRELLGKAGVTPREALREREPGAVALVARDATDEEILAAMAAEPQLLQRPIVERGDRAVLARPAERVLDLL